MIQITYLKLRKFTRICAHPHIQNKINANVNVEHQTDEKRLNLGESYVLINTAAICEGLEMLNGALIIC